MMTLFLLYACLSGLMLIATVVGQRRFRFLTLHRPNVFTVFALAYFPTLAGTVWLGVASSRRELSSEGQSALVTAVSLGFVGVMFGAALVGFFMRYKDSELMSFLRGAERRPFGRQTLVIFIVSVLGVAAALLFVLYSRIGTIPGWEFLRIGAEGPTLRVLRASAYKTLGEAYTQPMNLVRLTLVPYLIIVATLQRFAAKKMSLGAWLAILAGGLAYNAYAGALYPVLALFVLVLLTNWVTGDLRTFRVVGCILAGVLILGFSGSVVMPQEVPIATATWTESIRLVERLFVDTPVLLGDYVEYTRTRGGFLGGAAHRPLALVLGKEHVNVANLVFVWRHPDGFELGNASVPFVGYLWADFGLSGVAVGALVLGVVLALAHIAVVRSAPSMVMLATYIMVTWCGYATTASSITTGLLSKGLVPALALGWLLSRASLSASVNRSADPLRNDSRCAQRG